MAVKLGILGSRRLIIQERDSLSPTPPSPCVVVSNRVLLFRSQYGRDVAAIALANANMGDYKLKSSPEYEVRLARRLTTVPPLVVDRRGEIHLG